LTPRRITLPPLFAEQRNLGRADVWLELCLDMRVHHPPTVERDLPYLGSLFLKGGEFVRDLRKRFVEDGNAVFDAELDLRVLRKRLLPRLTEEGRFQRDRFVATLLRQLHTALRIAVLDVIATENDERALER